MTYQVIWTGRMFARDILRTQTIKSGLTLRQAERLAEKLNNKPGSWANPGWHSVREEK